VKLTANQSAAIAHRGSNLLVAASAGSGKTEVLARRCLDLVADPRQPCRVDQLLVVTFTRAAAAELRARIGRMLRQAGRETRDPRTRDHLRRQQVLVDATDIGTIDAWCGRMVREHFADAGVDVGFTVLGEHEARLLRQDVLDELFRWIYTSDEELAVRGRAFLSRHARPSDTFLRELIARLNMVREHVLEPDGWLARQGELVRRDAPELEADARQVLVKGLAAECRFQVAQVDQMLSAGAPELREHLSEYAACLRDWAERLAGGADLLDIANAIKSQKLSSGGDLPPAAAGIFEQVQKRWFGDRLKGRWEPETIERIIETAVPAAGLLDTLLRLETRYHDLLTATKQRRATYEFGDVLRMTYELLGAPPDDGPRRPTPLALRLRQRYEHVLVDEFQDTSPIQVEILRLVSRDEPGRTNRFLVGDVKQSIYGFRQAEPRLFAELAAELRVGRSDGRVQPLTENFRSHADLLDGLNRIFAMLFDPALGGTAYGDEERLSAGRGELPNETLDNAARIDVQVLEAERGRRGGDNDEGEDDALPLERVEREAVIAADVVRDLLSRGVMIVDHGAGGEPALRPLRLGDIAILLRSAKVNAGQVASVLREMGVPCATGGRESVLGSIEVMDVRNALTLVANRRQDVPLAAYLRGPFVGLSERELMALRPNSNERGFLDAVTAYAARGPDAHLRERVRAALAQLDGWVAAARIADVPSLLRRIVRETGHRLFALALRGGAHRAGLLRALESIADEFAATGQHGVAEFVAYLDQLEAREVEPGAAVATGDDVVRVMTIHAAKGLEFPVVLLLYAGSEFNRQCLREPLQWDEREGIGLRFFDFPARREVISARQQLVRHARFERELEEELRLLYVALTRARERLFIIGHAKPGAWDALQTAAGQQSGVPPLITRLTAKDMLEWILTAVAANGAHEARDGCPPRVRVTTREAASVRLPEDAASGAGAAAESEVDWGDADEAWVRVARQRLEVPPPLELAELPAVLSVSAAKELARREALADQPQALDHWTRPLEGPSFGADRAQADARLRGTAAHRFLEQVNLESLASAAALGEEIEAQVRDGFLGADEAALVPREELLWFGASESGRLVAAHAAAARRELAFVYALAVPGRDEHTIVRGVIDLLLDLPQGLLLLDYKTDEVDDGERLAERIVSYRPQVQLYAFAASAILGRPVWRSELVFLHARRCVAVPPAGPGVLAAALLAPLMPEHSEPAAAAAR